MNHQDNTLGSRAGQDELRQEACQGTHGGSPAPQVGAPSLGRPEEFVNDEHYRPAGKREEQNGEINSKYS